jgi:hypothetical protein
MDNSYDVNKIKLKIVRAMRKATPKDTGNLAYNSLRSYRTNTGVRVVYHGSIAGYGKILNQSIILGENKINKHFGWHNRANLNAILEIRRYFKDSTIPKNSKLYNNRQEANYNPGDPLGSQSSARKMDAQKEKWYTNPARIRFETMNKV